MNERRAWLDQVKEEVLEPDRRIVDPHHHLWRHDETPYLAEDLWADTSSGHNVVETVFIECGSNYETSGPEALRPVGETRFVASIVKAMDMKKTGKVRIGAIVGHADLLLGAGIEQVLDAHIEAGAGLFRGIRHSAAWDASADIRVSHSNPPPDLYERPQTLEALKILGQKGFVLDAWNYHPFLPRLAALARKVPDTIFVMDHLGGPIGIGPYEGKRQAVFEQWKADITDLATCPNVVMKLGGMAMPVNGWGWHNQREPATSDLLVEAHGPYYRHAMECFGPSRCMFESNFPVDKRSLSYGTLWNAFKKLASDCSEAEKSALFEGTARKTYKLGEK